MSANGILQIVLDLLPLLIPILLIQAGLVIYALIDLNKRSTVKGTRVLWAVLLVIAAISFPMGILVSAAYLGWGRHAEV
jgi:hypothetical protein